MKPSNLFVSTVFLFAGYQAMGVTAQSLGYTIGKKLSIPGTFEQDMQKAIKISQQDLGCRWASRPLIYAFEDAVLFVNDAKTDYNSFAPAQVLSNGCWLPPSIASKSGYTGPLPMPPGRRPVADVSYTTTSLAAAGLQVPVNGQPVANAPAPADFNEILKNGVRLSQLTLGCTWAAKPFIYAFGDGVVFTDSALTTYNAYTFDDVTDPSKGCFMPFVIEGGPEDGDINENGETPEQEELTKYIDTHNAQELCVGRWRWNEKWQEGNLVYRGCVSIRKEREVLDTQIAGNVGLPGVTRELSPSVISVDLGVAEATRRTTDSGAAGISNDADTLRDCWGRVNQWVANFSNLRTVVNSDFLRNQVLINPQFSSYATLLESKGIDRVYNQVTSVSPNIQGAKCSDNKLGACIAYTSKRQCSLTYRIDYYTVNKRTDVYFEKEPNCNEGEILERPVDKSLAGSSKFKVRASELQLADKIEVTANKPRYDIQCTSGVHIKDIAEKYKYLTTYIESNRNKPGIADNEEFKAAVATLWALNIEKADVILNADPMGLDYIQNVHNAFPAAVFPGHSNAELGLGEPSNDDDM